MSAANGIGKRLGHRPPSVIRLVIAISILALPKPVPTHAQEAGLWRLTLPQKIEAFNFTIFGTVIVETKAGLSALDPETGRELWSRVDASDYLLVSGMPFALVSVGTDRAILDVETGQDRWKLSSLPFSAIKGFVHLPARNMLLVHGETTAARHTMIAARYDTGEVLWRQDGLYSTPDLIKGAAKVTYTDLQLPLIDTDDTIVLDPNRGGLMRLDTRAGRLLWRVADKNVKRPGAPAVGYSPLIAADDIVFVSSDKKLFAIDAAAGRVLWSRKEKFPSPVIQMSSTSKGLLVRGGYNLVGRVQRTSWKPYLALLDPRTGKTVWTTQETAFTGRSAFLLRGDTIIIGLEKGIASFDLGTGNRLTLAGLPKFGGGEDPCCLELMGDGRVLLLSSQNLRMVDLDGKIYYHTYLKAPGASFMAKLASTALLAAAGAASYAAASPGGLYWIPTGNPVLTARFRATVDANQHRYIFTETPDASWKTGFSLVRIAKESGAETGRLWFNDRSPNYRLDPATGIVVSAEDRTLAADRFDALHAR